MAKSFFSLKQPKEMYWLSLTEMCQRFAFYGIAYLLVLYLVGYQKFTDFAADQLFGIFTGAAFILPLLGGLIADRMNYKMPVVWGMLSTALGCFLMTTGMMPIVYAGLVLIALGTGVFTPSIYAILGSLYHTQHNLRDSGFSIYYAAVNIGSFLAMIILGAIGQNISWHGAFFLAGLIQLCGLFSFKKALKTIDLNKISPSTIKGSQKKKPVMHPHEKKRIWVICILSFFSIPFWMAYNQGGSSMNLFAQSFTNRSEFGFTMPTTWLVSSESLYLIILAIPLAKLYTYLTKRKMDPSPPLKASLSLISMGICFAIMAIGASQIPSGAITAAISPFYLFTAYFFMAIGEMLFIPIGLSLITHLSPRRFTALLVGVWYLCIGFGFYFGGAIAPLMSMLKTMSSFFGIFVAISFIAGLILMLLVKKLNKMRHLNSL